MNGRKKVLLSLMVLAVVVVATVLANRNLTRQLEECYGAGEIRYYEIGETVPFDEDRIYYTDKTDLNGYAIRVDRAEVLTEEEFLVRYGQTTETLAETMGDDVARLPERVCLISVTVSNENSNAPGFYLADLVCNGEGYNLYINSTLTILANDFLMKSFGDDLTANGSNMLGITVMPETEASVAIVYGFSKLNFNRRHWDNLTAENLTLQLTSYPVQKIVKLDLG